MSDSDSADDMPDACSLRLPVNNQSLRAERDAADRAVKPDRNRLQPKYQLERYGTQGPVTAVFIRNTQYQLDTPLPPWRSSATDCDTIQSFLQLIGADAALEKENVGAEDLQELFQELRAWDWKELRPRLVVVAVLAYGEGGQALLAGDGQWVETRDLIQGLQCPGLVGVPKILLLNMKPLPETAPPTLRRGLSSGGEGGHQGGGAETDGGGPLPGPMGAGWGQGETPLPSPSPAPPPLPARRLRMPKEADVLQIVSEVTCGAGSAGTQQQGNIFLSSFAENVVTHGRKLEACQLLTRVNQQLARALGQSAAIATAATNVAPPRRASFFVSTLTKELYLFPQRP